MFYNPLDKFYKSITGAVPDNKQVKFRVKGNFDSVLLLLKKDGEETDTCYAMEKINDYFELSLKLQCGLYFYCFWLPNNEFIGLGDDYVGVKTYTPERFQLSVYSHDFYVPEWIKGGVIYQIFPDRFCRVGEKIKLPDYKVLHDNWLDTPVYLPNEQGEVLNNDFFGGNLKGIASKLEYLEKLGVTTIYLNPIFKAYSNHRYDTGNYMQIDELLGTESDFVELINKANKKGINIILDGVFNHTGADSVYFNKYGRYDSLGAYQSENSKYYSWYSFDKHPDKYESWWGIKTLPAVNESDSGFIDYIAGENGVLEHYTKLGVKGWRLDVVDELPDSFVKKIRSAVKNVDNDAIIIGEVWEDASNKIAYDVRREYFLGYELDSVMNYPLKNAILDFVRNGQVTMLSKVVKEQIDHYPSDVLHSLMNILSTHDTLRLITALSGEDLNGKTKSQMEKTFIPQENLDNAKLKLRIATFLQYTLYGVPSVYYGDEIGMQGYVDPLNRRCYPWGNEDNELIEFFSILGKMRKEFSAFNNGDTEIVFSEDGVIVFKRITKDCEVLVCVNVDKETYLIEFDGELMEFFSGKTVNNGYDLLSNSMALLYKKV